MNAKQPIRKNEPTPAERNEPLDIHATLRARKTAWRVPELAELLSLGRRTLYDVIQSGELPAIKIGTAVRISPAVAMTWIEAMTTGTERRAA